MKLRYHAKNNPNAPRSFIMHVRGRVMGASPMLSIVYWPKILLLLKHKHCLAGMEASCVIVVLPDHNHLLFS